jgi:outer membrane protein TolC
MNNLTRPLLLITLCLAGNLTARAAEEPLTLDQCLDLALRQNPAILKSQAEMRRTHGLIVEARAEAFPQVVASGSASVVEERALDAMAGTDPYDNQRHPWNAKIEVTQLLYSGGRVNAGLRAAQLTKDVALLGFQRAVADTVLAVRRNFYQILLAQSLVTVREQSVNLLESQLKDVRSRFDAGTVPQFNVLRAEVELANAKPPLIRAQNNLRLARESLVRLLALDDSTKQDFTSLRVTGQLTYESRAWELAPALAQALDQRPELKQAAKQVSLYDQAIIAAGAGSKPTVSLFGNYGVHNYAFSDDAAHTRDGLTVGARVSWPAFDGFLTKGRVQQAQAQRASAAIDETDARRGVELEVRQAYSDYKQALELLETQKKTVEAAEESLRLADARFKAGAGTQLDVLSAQTALTEARSNQIQALYEYNLANANLDRVTGATVRPVKP